MSCEFVVVVVVVSLRVVFCLRSAAGHGISSLVCGPFLSYKIGLDFLTFCFPDEILTKKHALPHRSVNSEALNKNVQRET